MLPIVFVTTQWYALSYGNGPKFRQMQYSEKPYEWSMNVTQHVFCEYFFFIKSTLVSIWTLNVADTAM